MSRLSEELRVSAEDAETRAREYLADGSPEGYEAAMELARELRRLAGNHAGTANDPAQFVGRSTAEVAEELHLTVSHVRRLARELGIGKRVGRDWRFSGHDVEALRRRGTSPGRRGETIMAQRAEIEINDYGYHATARFFDSRYPEPFSIMVEEDNDSDEPFSVTDSSDADPVRCRTRAEAIAEFKRQVAVFITDDWGEEHN